MGVSSVFSKSVAIVPSFGARVFAQAASAEVGANKNAVTQAPSPERVAQAVKQVNEIFIKNEQNLYASIEKDKATGINVVKILDKKTKEVISQFPSKAIIAFAEVISQSQAKKGQLIHARA